MASSVLVVGGGGREHALAWKLSQSPQVAKVFVAPGNAGTAAFAENVPLAATDVSALLVFAREHDIALTVVGPDDVLALGIVDEFQAVGLAVFGPTQAAAEIEASKAFAKDLMARHHIPTATYRMFSDYLTAKAYVDSQQLPIVIKASGLALGKGVIIAQTREAADAALKDILIKKMFGAAGDQVIIEEFLEGPEISIHALSDGKDFVMLPTAQDHKAAQDGGKGPNTGGMGTIAPLAWVTAAQLDEIRKKVVAPALAGLAAEGRAFAGLLYPGLKMTPQGPKVLEFNARWGDPETQSYMRLLKSDLYELLLACAEGRLAAVKNNIEWSDGAACCIVMASGGYPGAYEKGKVITGIEEAEKLDGVKVFHAGTARRTEDGAFVTSGGRVLGVTAVGADLPAALTRAYEAVSKISFEGAHFRTDIGRS